MKSIWTLLILCALFEFTRMWIFEPDKLATYLSNGFGNVPYILPDFKDPNKTEDIKRMNTESARLREEGLQFLRTLQH